MVAYPTHSTTKYSFFRKFGSVGTANQTGIYAFSNNSISVISNRSSFEPNSATSFRNFGGISNSGRDVVFSSASFGLFSKINGQFNVVVDNNTTVPGTQETFKAWPAFNDILSDKLIVFIRISSNPMKESISKKMECLAPLLIKRPLFLEGTTISFFQSSLYRKWFGCFLCRDAKWHIYIRCCDATTRKGNRFGGCFRRRTFIRPWEH